MPKLSLATKNSRRLQIFTAMSILISERVTKEEACSRAGISTETLNRYLMQDEFFEDFREQKQQYAREQLILALEAHRRGTELLIGDLSNIMTKPTERLKIVQYFQKQAELLEDQIGSNKDSQIADILKGPPISPQDQLDIRITVEKKSPVIIDSSFEDDNTDEDDDGAEE